MLASERDASGVRIAALSVGSGLIAIGGFAIVGFRTGWSEPAAAWVQAAAASLGMAVAIGVAGWQGVEARRLIRDQANADLGRRLDALMGLLQAANHEVWRWRRFLLRRPPSSRRDVERVANVRMPFQDDLERLERALDSVVLHELPSREFADAVLLARRALGETKSVGTQILQGIEMGQSFSNPLVPQVAMAANAISMARAAQERALGSKLPPIPTEHPQEPMEAMNP